MNYRKMPCGDDVSILGFGCMRFPLDDNGSISKKPSEEMLLHGINNGINYIDTAWPYHNGESEPFVGDFLEKHNLRKKVKLATKLPSWLIKERKDMDHYLEEQFSRLKTDYIDYYLIHALNKDYWNNLKKNDIFDFLDKVKSDGRVKNIGFSFHDDLELFKEITDSYNWDFCQIQYNYLDTDYQAGREGLDYATERNLGVIVMEPLRGGKIASKHPHDIQGLIDSLDKNYTSAEWALRWVYDHPAVTTVLSGMSTLSQVDENIKTASTSQAFDFSSKEKKVFEEIRRSYLSKIKVHCTTCKYCLPCPVGINIPGVFRFYNEAYIFGDLHKSKEEHNKFIKKEARGDKCIACGNCEKVCPQNIKIISHLAESVKLFNS